MWVTLSQLFALAHAPGTNTTFFTVPAGSVAAAMAGAPATLKAADNAAGMSKDFITGSNGS
jgi:hypothetical protein